MNDNNTFSLKYIFEILLNNIIPFLFFRYKIELADFQANHGGSLMAIFNKSPYLLLKTVFSDFDFQPWLFSRAPKGFFENRENRKLYISWLLETVGTTESKNLIFSDFKKYGGGSLLEKYGGSVAKILQSLTESDENPISIETVGKRSKAPLNYWVIYFFKLS